MALPKNIENKKYGKLTAIKFVEKRGQFHLWLFKCDCGKETLAYKNAVTFGNTTSCGCVRAFKISLVNLSHGLRKTRFYTIWNGMNNRCKESYQESKYYFKKGIEVDWVDFMDFKNDMYESYLEHCLEFGVKNTTIDRIDGNKNYCKENCRWATYKEQANNRTLPSLIINTKLDKRKL